jgi:hypothetical protein
VIVDAIQSLAQILTKSSPIQSGQGDRQTAYQLQLTPGQQVQAEVMASLPNQRFLARIAGKLFNIELPIIVQPGETLQLTYVTGEPNTTFTLSRTGNSSSPVAISDAGRLLNQLSLNAADPRQAGSLGRGGPVLSGPPSETSIFAKLLGEALTLNGIFYESHLLQWFFGERSLKDILKEPQGKLSKRSKSSAEGRGAQGPCGEIQKGSGDDSIDDELPATEKTLGPVDPRTAPIVREQLQTLHSGQVVWHGEVWPRQEMEWSVGEEKRGNGEGLEKGWVSSLRLDLPNLGEVAATLRLEKEGLSIHINVGSESVSATMLVEQQRLAQAMSDAGIKLLNVAIEHEEHGK